MSNDKKAIMVEKARIALIVKFKDGNTMYKWGQDWLKPRIVNINDSINDIMRVFDEHWRNQCIEAAIFDTRELKKCHGTNKLMQFENGSWKQVAQIIW